MSKCPRNKICFNLSLHGTGGLLVLM
jgi:hypothetical protein